MTAWIRLMVEVEDENRNVTGVNMDEKAFNNQMMHILQGSDLNEIDQWDVRPHEDSDRKPSTGK